MTRRLNQWRPTLDSFNFWIGVAYLGLAAVVVVLFILNQRSSDNIRRTAADEAAHSAEIVSAARSRYQQCVGSIPELAKINRFIRGVQLLHIAQEQNALAVLKVTPRHDPTYMARYQSYLRFKAAADKVKGVHFDVATVAECRALRKRLLNQKGA